MKSENTIYTLLVVVALSFPFRVEASAALAADQTALPQDTVIFSWEGDSLLRLRFPLYADISRRWCSQYCVSATPEVCDSLGNSIPLPTSVFAGKKNVRFNSRLLTLGIIDSIPQTVDIRDTVVYDTLLFVPESMRFACPALCVDRFEEGCGRTNRMPDELIAALDCRTDEPDEEPAEETGNDSIVTGPDGIIPVFRPLPDDADTPADAIRPADAGHPANRQMVAAIDLSDLPERDRILQIIDGSRDPDDKEWLIKTFDGGKPWRYISEHILPRQRVAGFIKIYYRNAE